MDPIWMAFWGLVLAALLYFAAEQRRAASDAERRQDELAEDKVDTYIGLAPKAASGIYALAMLGLHELDSDKRIRAAIETMRLRSGQDPLGKETRPLLEGVDLKQFFGYVAEAAIKFNETSVAEVLAAMEAVGSERPGRWIGSVEDLRLGDVPWADYVGDGWPMGSLYDLDGSLLDTQPIRLRRPLGGSTTTRRCVRAVGHRRHSLPDPDREPNRPARHHRNRSRWREAVVRVARRGTMSLTPRQIHDIEQRCCNE